MNRLWHFAMVLLASFACCAPALAQPPESHAAAKKLIGDIHEDTSASASYQKGHKHVLCPSSY